MRAVRNWVSVQNGDDAVVWVTKDAPLVHPGTISLPYAPFPASTSPARAATVYSWLHNNVWDTNFPIEQGFTATFEYAIGVRSHAAEPVEAVAVQTTADLVRPLAAVPASGIGGAGTPTAELLTISDPRVRLVSVVAGDDATSIVRLQSFADVPVDVELTFGVPVRAAARTTYLGDDTGAPVALHGTVATTSLAPFEAAAIRVRRGAGVQ
jgi:hypothetical protein